MTKINLNKGFTLVEMLVSLAIVITCATVVVAIISASFRTSNDTTSQESLRQQGTAALSQVMGMIKYADSFGGAYLGEDKVQCQTPSSEDSSNVDSIQVTSNATVRTIACTDNSLFTLDGEPLLDPANVKILSCEISCTQNSSSDQPVISVTLDLSTPEHVLSQESSANIYHLSKTVRMTNLTQ